MMAEASVLTVLAILTSLYGLMSANQRANFNIRLTWLSWVAFSIPLLVIAINIYSPIIIDLLNMNPIPYVLGFNKDIVVFTCLLFIIYLFAFKFLKTKLPRSRAGKLYLLSTGFLRYRKFEELLYLLRIYHEQIIQEVRRERRRLYESNQTFKNRKYFLIEASIKPLRSRAFIAYACAREPVIVARLSEISNIHKEHITDDLFYCLLSDPQGSFYKEVIDFRDDLFSNNKSDIRSEILSFYLSNPEKASQFGIWNPIYEYASDYIKENEELVNYYNRSGSDFSVSKKRLECPLYIMISLFDIMVKQAYLTSHRDHMWLYFINYIVKDMLSQILRRSACTDEYISEFPTKFDYLIYEAFDTCVGWVELLLNPLERERKHRSLEVPPISSAIQCLGQLTSQILLSPKSTDRQNRSIVLMVVRSIARLDEAKRSLVIKKYLESVFLSHGRGSQSHQETIDLFTKAYQEIDHVVRDNAEYFTNELEDYLNRQL